MNNHNVKYNNRLIDEINEKYPHIKILDNNIDNKKKLKCQCTIHSYKWEVTPSNLLKTKFGCKKCGIEARCKKKQKTHSDFIRELSKMNNNIEVISIYENYKKAISCKCLLDGHIWQTTPNSLLSGHGCPKCGVKKVQSKTKKNEETFITQLHKVNNNFELISKYIDSHSKIVVRCKVCGYVWSTIPGNILYKKSSCPQCIGIVMTTEHFKKKVFEAVGNEYSVISEYLNVNTPIKFVHNKCNTCFEMKPSSFFKSKTKCSNKNCKHSIYIENNKHDFYKKIESLGYTAKSEYIGANSKILLKCHKCNTLFTLDRTSRVLERKYSCCPNCAKNYYTELNRIEYVKKFNAILGKDFELVSEYVNSDSPITILHKKCGNKSTYRRPGTILADYICPCKKCNITNGELMIKTFLEDNFIPYTHQKKYDDLIGINGGKLTYDFFLPNNNLLIEFQGKQHKEPIEYFGGKEQFEIQQEHDRRKREYAKSHNIKLLEIWYYDMHRTKEILGEELYKQKEVIQLYDEIIKTVNLTCDEVEILVDALSYRLAQCVAVGEEITVQALLEKIQ